MLARPYDLILFDFDGTLADSFPWFLSVFNEVARKYRFKQIPIGKVDEYRGLSSREIVRRLGIPFWKLPLVARHMRRLAVEETGGIRLFDGVAEMLERLAGQGVVIGIVTSNSEKKVREMLGPKVSALVAHYACSVGMFAKKRALKRIVRQARVSTSRSLYIGDETRDAQAARAAGMAFGGVAWGYAKPETLEAHGALLLFERLSEIG